MSGLSHQYLRDTEGRVLHEDVDIRCGAGKDSHRSHAVIDAVYAVIAGGFRVLSFEIAREVVRLRVGLFEGDGVEEEQRARIRSRVCEIFDPVLAIHLERKNELR